MKRNITILIIIVVTSTFFWILYYLLSEKEGSVSDSEVPDIQEQEITTSGEVSQSIISEPISNAKDRINKKPFGIYINPLTSPVQPERFTGYHTGTDFEITTEEASIDVPIYAICSGEIIRKEIIDGYGGVIIQRCNIHDELITALYGHLNIDYVQSLGVGNEAASGEKISILAQGGSDFAGGERKHLHLGIHKGENKNIRGYVNNESELSKWLDIENYL